MNKERVLFIIIYLPVTPTLRSRRLMAWGQLNITMVNKVPPPQKKNTACSPTNSNERDEQGSDELI